MRRGATVYLWELAWILPSIALPVGMLVALVVTAFGAGVHVPSAFGRVDPNRVAEVGEWSQPGVREVAPGRYEVTMLAQLWSFTPNEIRVPVGSTVHFRVTSKDVVHGLFIHKATVNTMVLPGQIAEATARFDKPGEYPIICHEYCGIAHQTMWARVIVSPKPGATAAPPTTPAPAHDDGGAHTTEDDARSSVEPRS